MKLEKNSIKRKLSIIKKKEQECSLTNRQKRVLKNIETYLKNLKKDLEKLQKYSTTYGLDYLFNELGEVDYYGPKEVKSAFNGNYVLYESKGNKDDKLALYKYFDIIKQDSSLADLLH